MHDPPVHGIGKTLHQNDSHDKKSWADKEVHGCGLAESQPIRHP
jgi:hypothetical protein